MSYRSSVGRITVVAALLVGCGKSTENSDPVDGSSGGASSSVASGGAGRGGTGGADVAGTTETASSSSGGSASSGGGTGGGGTMTSASEATSTTGNEGGAFSSGGATGMTAEEAGCIVVGPPTAGVYAPLPTVPSCGEHGELGFLCPREQVTPDTCLECLEPGVSDQGNAINQCLGTLPDGGSCKGCCCKPTRSGCEERESLSGCSAHADMPRSLVCVIPYEEPSGCTRTLDGDGVDTYCCP